MSERLLLDTHIAIWMVARSERLSKPALEMLKQRSNPLFVSAASIWEIAIKHALKSQTDPMPFSAERSLEMFRTSGLQLLDIRPEHAAAVEQIPPLHTNPFDRLLIAQARTEPMHFLTHDKALAADGTTVRVV